jgi:hypothetical protein
LLKGKMPLWQPSAPGRSERDEMFKRAENAKGGKS